MFSYVAAWAGGGGGERECPDPPWNVSGKCSDHLVFLGNFIIVPGSTAGPHSCFCAIL